MSNKAIRFIIRGAAVYAAVAIVGGMAILNFRFASKLSNDAVDSWTYGAMAVALVLLSTLVLLMIEAAWARKNRKSAVALASVGVFFAGWALLMSAGHITSNRVTVSNTADHSSHKLASLMDDEKRIRAELVKLSDAMVPGVAIQNVNFLTTGPGARVFKAAENCSDPTSKSQRDYCGKYIQAKAEVDKAQRADALKTELIQVETKISLLGPRKVGDGQAAALQGAFGGDTETFSKLLSFMQAVVGLLAEVSVMRIMIALFGWRPEELVGGYSPVLDKIADQAVAHVDGVPKKIDRFLANHIVRTEAGLSPMTFEVKLT